MLKNLNVPLALLFGVSTFAQPKPTLDCNHRGYQNRSSFCEMREQSVAPGSMLSVDAGPNGGISINGWDRSDILVRSQVNTYAPTDGEARNLALQVFIQATGSDIRANGPARDKEHQWAVSYEIFVPSRSSINLATENGGVSISDVTGNLEFKTVNGGLNLRRVGGYVHGSTTNGGVTIELAGDRWEGQGLEVATTNGGVRLRVPANYSAQLEAQTISGGIHATGVTELPAPDQAAHRISTALGAGGAIVKVTTTNGGVSVSRI